MRGQSSALNFHMVYGTRTDIDIGKWISENVDIWTTYGITLPYVILGFFLLIMTYVVVEGFVGKQISIQRFVLGPEIERNDPKIDNEG